MAMGMNFVRFMKGALKGEIAHQEAVAKADADRKKREQDVADKNKKFLQGLIANIPFEKIKPENVSSLGNIKTIEDVANVYSDLEEKKDTEGLTFLTKQIFKLGEENPNIFKNINWEKIASVTDMSSAYAYLENNPDVFKNITGKDEEQTQEQKDIFSITSSAIKEMNKLLGEGVTFTGKPLDFANLDMHKPETINILQAFLETAVPPKDDETPPEEKPDNYIFPNDKGKMETYFFKDSGDGYQDILSNMVTMTDKLIQNGYNFKDNDLQVRYLNEMNRQFTRASQLYRDRERNEGVIDGNEVLDISSYVDKFNNDSEYPMLKFASSFFDSMEKETKFKVTRTISEDGENLKKEVKNNLPVETESEFKDLAAILNVTPETLYKLNAHLQVDENDITLFTKAQTLTQNVKGLFRTQNGVPKNRLATEELPRELRKNLFIQLESLFEGTTDAEIENKIAVLQILSNIAPPVLKRGQSSYGIPERMEKYLISVASSVTDKNITDVSSALGLINKKADMGKNIMDLVNSQLSLFSENPKFPTGAVKELIIGIRGFMSSEGQLDQIKDFLINGSQSISADNMYLFREEDFESKKDFNESVDLAAEIIAKNSLDGSGNFDVQLARSVTNEVFLAYAIAKFNDEGGRLSNQDYSINVRATLGGALSNRDQAQGHLLTVKKRFQYDYLKFKNLRFNLSKLNVRDYSSATPQQDAQAYAYQMIRRLDATMTYYNLYETSGAKTAERIKNYKINVTLRNNVDKLKATNKFITNKNSKYYGEGNTSIFQVVDKKSGRPVFDDYGGLYAIQISENRYKTIPLSDVPFSGGSQAEDTSSEISSTQTAPTYRKLENPIAPFAWEGIDSKGNFFYLTQEEYDALNIKEEKK